MDVNHPNAQPFHLEGGEHAVLLIHGFTGTPAHLRPLGERLQKAGFTARGVLLQGHGTDLADMQKATWQGWVADALDEARALRERYTRVSVCGLSMGGCLALICAQRADIAGCVPISAPMKTKAKLTFLARPAALFVPRIAWRGGATHDASLLRDYNIGYAGFPTAKVYDLNVVMRTARRNLPGVTCPLLAVQSRADETISPDSADIILRAAQSKRKEVLWLEDAPHVCTLSGALEAIAGRVIDFLRQAEA